MPALNSIRKKFDKDLESAKLLFEVAEKFSDCDPGEGGTQPPVLPGQARRVAGLAFLVMVRAWEELVEACLVRYLAGAKAPSGWYPKPPRKAAKSLEPAYEDARNRRDGLGGGSGYLSVSDWSKVKKFAGKRFTDGQPFSCLTKLQQQRLKSALAIRNRIAHSSDTTRARFNGVWKEHEKPGEERPRGYTVGHLLVKKGKKGFGPRAPEQAFFLHYHGLFQDLAEVICPKQKAKNDGAGNPS